MVRVQGTIMSSTVLLCVMFLHGVCGTYFPPVSDPPPIPAQAINPYDNAPQSFYIQEDLPQNLPQATVKEEGLYPPQAKPDEQRWYFQENQSSETGLGQSSVETFDRYYQSGEPAVGPVATPMPDDAFVAQPSSISKFNPTDARNSGGSGIWILTSRPESQYSAGRWLQVPSERFVEVVNQDARTPVATDTVKSVLAPVPEIAPNPTANIVQQVWVQAPNVPRLQKIYTNSPTLVEDIPSVKQVVDISTASVKQVVQEQVINDVPFPPPGPQIVQQKVINDVQPALFPPPGAQVVAKKSFALPPPPPPPLKVVDASPKVVSSIPINVIPESNQLVSSKNFIPDSNVIVSGKNVLQQVRHVWIPTSARTGKFITIPVSAPIKPEKSIKNKGIPLDSTPVTVSDTWVLKQDGPVPSFEQQKSAFTSLTTPVVQSGKVIFQDPAIVQVDGPPNPPIINQINSQKNAPIVEKTIASNTPVDIWPTRKDITSSKIYGTSPAILKSELAVPPPKSDAVVIEKTISVPAVAPQKTIFTNAKSPLPLAIAPPALQLVNGKPCPIPPPIPQKSLLPSLSPSISSVPRVLVTQRRLPFARIVRVNRYPTGSYYLLNQNVRPNYFTYPNSAVIQQPKTNIVRLLQTKQIPVQLQSKQLLPPVQTKQISIPVQSKQIVPQVSTKQIAFPYTSRQIIVPVPSPRSARLIYPTVQAIRYAYPWNGYVKSNPISGKGVYLPQLSPLKKAPKKTKSDASSSESSSSESSSSESSSKEEKKEEKPKKEKQKPKKEEKSEEEEKSSKEESKGSEESQREMESESNSKETEKESEEKSSEKEVAESLETSESQISLKFHVENNDPGLASKENA